MKLAAPPAIIYQFDGKPMSIPVTLTGTPADVTFCVFTRNQGAKISKVTNGFLGWHYVNGIDTCIYLSPSNQMDKGANVIAWDGKGEGGVAVPPGEYSYYLFGFDNKSARTIATAFLMNSSWCFNTFVEKNNDGEPLANPLMYRVFYETPGNGIVMKWIIGNDPVDAALVETTKTASNENSAGSLAILPIDQSKLFVDTRKDIGGTKVTRKWTWVPNGDAVLDTSWAIKGEFTYTSSAEENYGPGVVSDGKDWLFLSNADYYSGNESKLIILNVADGKEVKRIDISQWWVNLNDGKAGGQNLSGPTQISCRNGLIALGAHGTCLNSVMNPYAETTDDTVLWVNRNGDYIGDKNWDPSSPLKWICNDNNSDPYKYTSSIDDNGFVIFTARGFNFGFNSFGLYAPDGTGTAYKNYAKETNEKIGVHNYFVDYGSAYDGIYSGSVPMGGVWFAAHDSFKGVITNQTAVSETDPLLFSIAQNTPNPFNPNTTINFTLTKAGKTTVEVYNTAGQKIDTILNANLGAGTHSVTWNAGRLPSGVYFYTVRSGGFSGTGKMTLLK